MEINKYIDHTLLKADAKKADIEKLASEARQYHFASCCINPGYVPLMKKLLAGSDVKVCTVIGFPLGAAHYLAKGQETKIAIEQGADEVDMVINIGALKDHDDELVLKDIKEVVKNAQKRVVKVIIETSLLNEEEKIRACQLIMKAGADFVKTSTGFSTGGATIEDIKLFKKTVGDKIQIKASGGVKDRKFLMELIAAGANRIGTSSGVSLIQTGISSGGY